MTLAQYDKLPDCFRQVIDLDRRRRAPVVRFEDIAERRLQRRMCEIHILDAMGRTEGGGRPASVRL